MPSPMRMRGFTLIELLVAIMLVALLMTLVYEGLRSGMRAAETGQAFIDRSNKLRITHGFVRHQLSRLMPLTYRQDTSNGKLYVFEGNAEKIRFVGPMPGYLGSGGPYVQELEIIRDGGSSALVYRHWLLNGFDEDEIDRTELPVRLIDGVKRGKFEFRGLNPDGKLGDWTERWDEVSLTPLAIRLDLEMTADSRLQWPMLEVAMMVDGGSTRGFNAGFMQDQR